ncbi:MAG: hypothetical protein JRE40_01715 [Deltaproteobacteria bacterium]|nr:hypothetical protein [Deltaproteobacteria bacterium]MBW2672512.1 hypothetical protein [Deltaproteobacteria bacterium]
MPEEKPEKMKVTILRVREYEVGPSPEAMTKMHDILFQAPDMVPLLITLPAEEDTPEGRAAAIRKKIEEQKARKPEVIEV